MSTLCKSGCSLLRGLTDVTICLHPAVEQFSGDCIYHGAVYFLVSEEKPMYRNGVVRWCGCAIFGCAIACGELAFGQGSSSVQAVSAPDLGISFVNDSSSQVIVERDGKRYVVDLVSHEIRPIDAVGELVPAPSTPTVETAKGATGQTQPETSPAGESRIYTPGDDLLFNVPTGRRTERHSLTVNFTHRFPYEAAFTGPGRGATLAGLDDFAVPSLGFRYGVTSKLSVFAYRSPSIIGRPIELMAAYNFLDEHDGHPVNAAVRFSVDGQNDFSNNFAENFELILSRSVTHRAQLYAVPTFTIHQRPLISNPGAAIADAMPNQPCSAPRAVGIAASFNARPCANTFSLAAGVSVDIRPTVAIVAEVTPTLVNGSDLGIHRPEYAFGIQKKIWRHAFTFGLSNGPGSLVSQRGGTRATFLQNSTADKPGGLFVGFDLTRQLF
jgi:hypothetical protein